MPNGLCRNETYSQNGIMGVDRNYSYLEKSNVPTTTCVFEK